MILEDNDDSFYPPFIFEIVKLFEYLILDHALYICSMNMVYFEEDINRIRFRCYRASILSFSDPCAS